MEEERARDRIYIRRVKVTLYPCRMGRDFIEEVGDETPLHLVLQKPRHLIMYFKVQAHSMTRKQDGFNRSQGRTSCPMQ